MALAENCKLTVPVLAVGSGGGPFTVNTMSSAASADVNSASLDGVGHYAAMEAPERLAASLLGFFHGIDGSRESAKAGSR